MGTCISKGLDKHKKNHNSPSSTEPDPPQDKLIISHSPPIPKIPPQPLQQTCSSSTPSTSSSSSSSSSIFTFNSSNYSSSNANLKPPQITILNPHKRSPTSLSSNNKLRVAHPVSITANTCKKLPANTLLSKRYSSSKPTSISRNNNSNHSDLQKKLREARSVSITANACRKSPVHCIKKPNPLLSKRSSPSKPVSISRNNNSNHSNLQKKLREAHSVSITADTCRKAPAHCLKNSKGSSPAQAVALSRNNNKLRKPHPVSITANACKQVIPSNYGLNALNAGRKARRGSKDEVDVSSSAHWGCSGEVISICIAGFPPLEDFDHPLVSMDCFIFV